MKRFFLHTFLMLLALSFALPTSFAQSGAANTARENARAGAEGQARAEIESLLARLCPGRCELVELKAVVSEPRALGEVIPGFEASAGARYEAQVRRIEATILMDSNLPENFRTNIPRMAQFRLQYLAPTIEIRPEFLDFPQPQLPPMPEMLPRTPQEPPPPAPTFPIEAEAPPVPAPQPETAPTPPAPPAAPLWQELLPWIALLLTLLILGGLILLILRRLEALAEKPEPLAPGPSQEEKAASARPQMPDVEALRAELKQSRPVLNRMLRRWVEEDPQEVALLIRLVGTEILADLQRDPQARNELQAVSAHVAQLHKSLDAKTASEIAEKARARHAAQLVVEDGSGDARWDFLEGLSLEQIGNLLQDASPRERGFVLSRLTPVFRSRYMENLEPTERRRLLLEASDGESLSRSQARELAGRLRKIADEFIDSGRHTQGQAAMIVEMIDAMSLSEQEETLRDLRQNRPDVAKSVLSQICLESSLSHLPSEALSAALHRLPVDVLTAFLQGTDPQISSLVLNAAPASRRQALQTELSLEIPSTRADFLEARQAFFSTILATLRRDGYDISAYNLEALRPPTQSRTASSELTS